MQTPDLLIIILFLLAMTIYGIWQGRSNRSTGDYFLGGRNLPWVVAMFSIVATETSVLTFVSIPGIAYRGDWTFLQLAMGYILGRVLVSAVLLPAYFREGVTSIYEIIGTRFGTSMQKLASSVFLITRILADGVRYLATAVVVEAVTGWSLSASVLVIGLVTLTYTLSGGIRTVVWLDSIQFVLYLAGGIITIGYILQNIDIPPGEAMTHLLEAGKLKLINPDMHLLSEPWAFFSAVTGGILLSFASHGVDYMMVQRALGCRNLGAARKAMIGSGIFVFLQFSVFLLAGSLIFIFLGGDPGVEKDREFASFIVNHLPVGLKGILLAGVLSAAMSTLSSSINSLASSTVTDLLGGSASLNQSRLISLGWAAVLITIALGFDESDSAIVILGLQIASFTYGGLLALFLLSKSSRNFSPVSLGTGLVAGMTSVMLLQQAGIAWTWYICFALITTIAIAYSIDLLAELFTHKNRQ
ncbi:MAG: sodium:solute symporter [Prosthecochloris sp.]|uniref:sodium:solute symporter n=1 Tax=Prosthecochloris sp. ZM_2 TaxID=2045206 RepID=UPI000DF76120|nr:sodium:solute symporter [Prosthecochloris sp. ZM_2]MEC9486177.1 sodium:solute symporter [Prosthecochloris sp.]RNA64179.1 sodium:solute symporter [Prosthecochloris sp. ZM_2]